MSSTFDESITPASPRARDKYPARLAGSREKNQRGRPAETGYPQKRRRTKGTLILDGSGRIAGGLTPGPGPVRVAFPGRSGSTEDLIPEEAVENGDGIQLLKVTHLDRSSTHRPLFDPLSRHRKVSPHELLGKSLIAGKDALMAHFALLAYHQCPVVDLDVVDTILARGADINAVDTLGQSVLHEVARLWDKKVASHLISKGIKLDIADDFGRQPLHVAAGEDAVEIVKLLLDEGADVNALTALRHQTVVHHAAQNDSVKALACLIEHNATYEDRDYVGRTPLQLAVELDRTEAVRFLLSLDTPAFAGVVSSDGRKAMTAMIIKMPEVASIALEQFHSTSASQRSQLYWLNYFEHAPISEGEAIDGGGVKHDQCKALTPLDVIVQGKHYSLLTTPIILRSLKTKWRYFGKRRALFQTMWYMISVLVWTVVALSVDWQNRHMYPTEQIWRIVFEVLAVIFLIYDCGNEVMEYVRSRRQHYQWADWRLASLKRDLKDCHPACPDEAEYIRQEIREVSKSSAEYFEDLWNLLDWTCYLLMISSVISHVIDLFQHTRTIARVHAALIVATVIFLWIRSLKYLRAFRTLGPFVVMVTRIVRDVFKFIFLYLIIFIPYACGFWVFFGGARFDEARNSTMTGFEDESDMIFKLFMATIGNEAFVATLIKIDALVARVMVGSFLALTAILLLNLLIALMSDTFQRVHDNVNQNSLMQQAATVITMERNLSPAERQKFRQHVAKTCSPERLYYDDDDADQEDLNKIARQTYDEVVELKDFLTDRNNQDSELREEIALLRQEVQSLRTQLNTSTQPPKQARRRSDVPSTGSYQVRLPPMQHHKKKRT